MLTIIGSDVILTDRNLEVTTENKENCGCEKIKFNSPVITYVDSDDDLLSHRFIILRVQRVIKGVLYSHENILINHIYL